MQACVSDRACETSYPSPTNGLCQWDRFKQWGKRNDSVMKTSLVNVVQMILQFVLVIFVHDFSFLNFCLCGHWENIMAGQRADLSSQQGFGPVPGLIPSPPGSFLCVEFACSHKVCPGFPAGRCLKQHITKSNTGDLCCCVPAKLGVPSQPGEWSDSLPFCPLVWGRKIHIWITNCADCRRKLKSACCSSTIGHRHGFIDTRHRCTYFQTAVGQRLLTQGGIDEPGGQDWNILADRPSANWGIDRKGCQVNKEDVSRLLCPSVICVGGTT